MSDILIRAMEMPKNCGECPFSQYRVENLYNYCMILKRLFAESYKRLDNCPLHELPPHGDLIDRDKCIDYIRNNDVHAWEALAYEDVIVPSNKEV